MIVWLRTHLEPLLRRWWASGGHANWKEVIVSVLGGLLLAPLVNLLPMLGFDWTVRFYPGAILFNTPWVNWVVAPFRLLGVREALAVLNSIMLVTVAVATAREANYERRELWVVALALFTPPIFMVMWDGQIDGLALLGLFGLPWLVPFALVRPHLTIWAILSRRNWTLGAMIFGALSLIFWGWWPATVLGGMEFNLGHPMAMGWARLGWPIGVLGIVMLIFAGDDIYRLLAAGTVAASYLMPYHFLILLPSMGRVKGWRRIVLWACAWLSLLVPALADPTQYYSTTFAHYLALLYPILVWWFLRNTKSRWHSPLAASHF